LHNARPAAAITRRLPVRTPVAFFLALTPALCPAAQPVLYGVRPGGDVLVINPATGAAWAIGASGLPSVALTGYQQYGGRGIGDIHYLISAPPSWIAPS
jgi:hypothetical protein